MARTDYEGFAPIPFVEHHVQHDRSEYVAALQQSAFRVQDVSTKGSHFGVSDVLIAQLAEFCKELYFFGLNRRKRFVYRFATATKLADP